MCQMNPYFNFQEQHQLLLTESYLLHQIILSTMNICNFCTHLIFMLEQIFLLLQLQLLITESYQSH